MAEEAKAKRWTRKEDEILMRNFEKSSPELMTMLPGRSEASILNRWWHLKQQRDKPKKPPDKKNDQPAGDEGIAGQHDAYHGFLENVLREHDGLAGGTAKDEITFFENLSAKCLEIVEYTKAWTDFEKTRKTLQALGAGIGLKLEAPEGLFTMPSMRSKPDEPAKNEEPPKQAPDEERDDPPEPEPETPPKDPSDVNADRPDDEASTPVSEPQPEPDKQVLRPENAETPLSQDAPKKSLDDWLPPELRNPKMPRRLRIFRILSGLTAGQVAAKTGITRDRVYELENEKTLNLPTGDEMIKLATAYNTTAKEIMSKSMAEKLSVAKAKSREDRLRIIRVRAGLSIENLANKLGMQPVNFLLQETNEASPDVLRAVARILNVPESVLLDGKPPADASSQYHPSSASTTTNQLTKGQLILTCRTKKGVDQQTLAKMAGCSPGHLSRIESGYGCPSDELLHKIADALEVSFDDLNGLHQYQPKSAIPTRSDKAKAARHT